MNIGFIMTIVGIIVVGLILAAIVVIRFIQGKKRRSDKSNENDKKNVLLFAKVNKRLAQNPRDTAALMLLAKLYFQEENWEKAFKTYATLINIAAFDKNGIDEFEMYLRYGISAMKMGDFDEAGKNLIIARTVKEDNFEVNYYLGTIELQKNNFERALNLLTQAQRLNPDHALTQRDMGRAYLGLGRAKEAAESLRSAIEQIPQDKDALFALAETYYSLGHVEQAQKIFRHLRPDPTMGANASLFSGIVNMNQHRNEAAIEDFEIGLKHTDIDPDTLIELRYRIATAYIKQNDINKALKFLKTVEEINPDYKDIKELISKYYELSCNQNLQIYLTASLADFIALCRRIVLSYFPRGKVKLSDITVNKSDWDMSLDIIAETSTPEQSETVFRFIRTEGLVGEVVIRSFYIYVKDRKASKGLCFTAGTFTDEAKHYTEARPIDLMEKPQIVEILHKVDSTPK
jgi:lipopolysaccharide biosynthesis regulator YciM